jgi:hypothetical protein
MANFTASEPVSYMGPIAEDTTRGHLAIGTKVPRRNANKSGRPNGLNCRSLHCGSTARPTASRGRRDGKGMGGCSPSGRRPVERTADPSTSLGMTKGGGASIGNQMLGKRTAGRSTVVPRHAPRRAGTGGTGGMAKGWVVPLHQGSQTGQLSGRRLARLCLALQRLQESN